MSRAEQSSVPPPAPRLFPEWSEAFQVVVRERTMLDEEGWIDPDGYWRLDCLETYYRDMERRHPELEPSMWPTRTLARLAARASGYEHAEIPWPKPASGRWKPLSDSTRAILEDIHAEVVSRDKGR